ncbi:MAG: tetratricopeptide repeat protein [Bacteroidales bacterium]|nr:MAG: tetratricopeptide repeat protein [Bacteroidales bacterium]
MKSRKQVKIWITILFVVLSVSGYSQTKNDAIAAYNEGVQLLKSDPEAALTALNRCIEICTSLGEEGDDTKVMAEIQIPKLQYSIARTAMQAKEYEAAIEKFTLAIESAEKYNDNQVKGSSLKLVPQLHYIVGNSYSKNKEFEKALENYEKAIEYNPVYTKAFLGKGLVYRETGDLENMKTALDKTIELGLNINDTNSVETAEQVIRITYFNKAVKAITEQSTDEAEEALKTTIEYGNNSVDAYYQLAKIYNGKSNWSDAIEMINKAIEIEAGDETVKAKLFYELATSYVGQGETDAACEAFKKAAFGAYAENANYQIEHVLKCN